MEKAHSIYQTSTMPIVSQAGQTVSSTPQLPRPVPTVPASEVAALCNPTSARSVTPLSPNVLLFNDTSAHYHWGCTGTSWALKECINRLGFELQTVPIATTYSLLAVPPFEEFDGLEQFHSFQEANETILRQMQSADLIVITGEGTIHDLGDGPRALLYLAYISKKFLSKHVEIINHSAYPKDGPLSPTLNTFLKTQEQDEPGLLRAQEIYKSVYGKLDFVAIRESFSREVMSRLGVSSTLSFDCLPLYIRDHYHNPKDVQRKTVVLAGAPDFSESQGEQLCGYLERLYHEGYEVKVLTGAAADPSRHDAAFAQFLKEHAKVPLNMVDASSMEEWLDTINNATLLVSNRFHHSIAGFCLSTPFIAFKANTHKLHAICSFFDQEGPLAFSDPSFIDHLQARTAAVLSKPCDNQQKIKEACDLAERNFEGLKRFLSDNSDSRK